MKQRNVFVGCLAAILGALVASIPWVLIYMFGNLILSPLATLVGMGAWRGYEFVKGKITPSLPTIITFITMMIVLIIQLLIIPVGIMLHEGQGLDIQYLLSMYSYPSFFWAIMKDLFVSFIFASLGIFSIMRDIHNRITTNTYESFEDMRNFR